MPTVIPTPASSKNPRCNMCLLQFFYDLVSFVQLCQKHGHGTFKFAKGGSYIGDYVDDMVAISFLFILETHKVLKRLASPKQNPEIWRGGDEILERIFLLWSLESR